MYLRWMNGLTKTKLMRDNFELIIPLLEFEQNQFYFIQILKRRKENPEMDKNVAVIRNLYVYSVAELDALRDLIKGECEIHNARAYINLNRLDAEKIALYTLKQLVDYVIQGGYDTYKLLTAKQEIITAILNRDFRTVENICNSYSIRKAYSTVCGNHHSEKDKRWVVDIDEKDLLQKDRIRKTIEELHREIKGNNYKILEEVPTRSGIHIITNPFNMAKFKLVMKDFNITDLDVHKNSPTILYL